MTNSETLEFTIDQKGNGDFNSLSQAMSQINLLKERSVVLKLKNGVYEENIVIERSNVTMIGEDKEKTIITGKLCAKQIMPDGTLRGTFRTATVRTDGNHIQLKNITIENASGNGRDHGQAVALYAEGDDLQVIDCRLLGCQDTLFTAPLPPKNKHGNTNGFGPKAECERVNGRQRYCNCYIEGDVDFIFGGATALFEECEIYSKNSITEIKENSIKGFVAAPCTPEGQEFGYLFYKCRLTGDCEPNTVYLGRPWRIFAKAVFIECELGEHIRREGFHDWDSEEAHVCSYLAEGNNRTVHGQMIDISQREKWVHQLEQKEAKKYVENFESLLNN